MLKFTLFSFVEVHEVNTFNQGIRLLWDTMVDLTSQPFLYSEE